MVSGSILKRLFFWVLIALVLMVTACGNPFIGIGTGLDIEAPELSITSHSNFSFVQRSFRLAGECRDNDAVTSVEIRESVTKQKWQAVINGNAWQCDITMEKDGEYVFDVYAYDKPMNTSSNSYKRITLTVNGNAPSATVTEPQLASLTVLKSYDPKDFTRIDYFRNQIFKIKGATDANYKIKSVKLELLSEGGMVQYSQIIENGEPLPPVSPVVYGVTAPVKEGSVWNWAFNVDADGLKDDQGNLLKTDTLYYFGVRITAENMAGSVSVENKGYLCVYKNANLPWAAVKSVSDYGNIQPGSVISGNAYDDDGVKKIYIKIIRTDLPAPGAQDYQNWQVLYQGSDETQTVIGPAADTPRLYTWAVTAPNDPQTYAVYVVTEDVNGFFSYSYDVHHVKIPDLNSPYSVVTSHTDRQVEINNEFILSGKSYDNVDVNEVKAALIPADIDPLTYNWSNVPALTLGSRVWDSQKSRWARSWSRNFVQIMDFSSDEQKNDKVFFIRSKDDRENVSYDKITLLVERNSPVITLDASIYNGKVMRTAPYSDILFGICQDDVSVIPSVMVTSGDVTRTVPVDPVTHIWSIPLAELEPVDGGYTFEVTAKDFYENTGYAVVYILIDNSIPKVTHISADTPSGAYRQGNLVLTVEFSKNVSVSGTPSLDLNFGGKKADYINGSGTSVLRFYYSIADGDNSPKVDLLNTNALQLNGGSIKDLVLNQVNADITLPAPGQTGSLGVNKSIEIDTTLPVLSSKTPVHQAADVLVGENIVLQFSEPVYKEDGNIDIVRVKKSMPVILSIEEFNQVKSQLSGASLTLLLDSYKLGTNGAGLQGTPDLTPRYILRYELDTTNEALLDLFDGLGYNQLSIPVSSNQVSGSGTQTIVINPYQDLAKGIEYYIQISSNAFRDKVGNLYQGITDHTVYRLTTGPAATPVIRINKQSGSGDTQPLTTSFKVDCDTVQAAIYYTCTGGTVKSGTYSGPVSFTDNGIAGQATLISVYAVKQGLTQSATVYEKAFKTVFRASVNTGSDFVWFRGSDNGGGPPTTPDFPMSWDELDYPRVKLAKNDGSNNWYFITWAINNSSVTVNFKPVRGNKPADWATLGPSWWYWKAGTNDTVTAGGMTTSSGINWEQTVHTR